MKKIFIVSAILFGLCLILWGIYILAFRPTGNSQGSKNKTVIGKVVNESGEDDSRQDPSRSSRIIPLTNEGVNGIFIDSTGKGSIKYYTTDKGNVYEITLDGAKRNLIAENNLAGLESVRWSPKGDRVITEFKNDGKSTFYVYDFSTKQGKAMKEGVDTVAWTNLGDRIVYKYFDQATKTRSVNVADPDGANWQKLADTPHRDLVISQIPQSSQVSFWNKAGSGEETDLEVVSVIGGSATKIFSGKFGADYLWSPDGRKALVSSVDRGGSKLMLGMIDSGGGNYQPLGIPTLTSKCAWSKNSEKAYCAWPSLTEGVVMPDDYLQEKIVTKDTFWRVDVTTGEKKRVIELDDLESQTKTYDVAQIFLTPEEDGLIFINNPDKKMYRINLD